MSEASPGPLPSHLVLFDGVCNFCDRSVRWLLERSRSLSFATLQGETAAALRRRHPEIPEELETLVYVESRAGSERVYLRSEAAFRVCAQLDGGWRRLAALRRLPRWLTDPVYRLFVRVRYRIFGKLSECRVPGPGEGGRFLR